MSDMKDDGGPAFPTISCRYEEGVDRQPGHLTDVYSAGGMTLRDYFAGKALGEWIRAHIENIVDDLDREVIARECYLYADAMIKERSKP